MKGTIISKSMPYTGPYETNVETIKIRTELGEITWHEVGNKDRGLRNCKPGETYLGFYINEDYTPNYKKSKLVLTQLKLEL